MQLRPRGVAGKLPYLVQTQPQAVERVHCSERCGEGVAVGVSTHSSLMA